MKTILVTGASGNVGQSVLTELLAIDPSLEIRAATTPGSDPHVPSTISTVPFDFLDPATFPGAIDGSDTLFLLRPPALSKVKEEILPTVDYALEHGVSQIVFLSLQGVQMNPFTPHFHIEGNIRRKTRSWTFLRPNFYMQNLSGTYADEIRERSEIFLPAGSGKTAFIDVRDIGAVAAKVMTEPGHLGKAYTLTGPESLDYFQIAETLTKELGRTITYRNPDEEEYISALRAQGAPEDYIKVQKMLYFVVRHNLSRKVTTAVPDLLGRPATTFRAFAHDYRGVWG